MAKAIFVIDEMPKSCEALHLDKEKDCPLLVDHYSCAGAHNKPVIYDCECDYERPKWCPLKDLPDYERGRVTDNDLIYLSDRFKHTVEFNLGHESGWNDCIDTITGDWCGVERCAHENKLKEN